MNKTKKTLEEMMAELSPAQGSSDYRGSSVEAPQGRVPIVLPDKVKITTDGTFFDSTEASPDVQKQRAESAAQKMPFGVQSGQTVPESRRASVEKRYGPLTDDEYADLIKMNNPELSPEQINAILMENAPNAQRPQGASSGEQLSAEDQLMLEMMLQDIWK